MALEIAKHNAKRARVENSIKIFNKNCLEIQSLGRRGTIVTNPPYGERLGTVKQIEELYRKMGKHFASLSPWRVYIITSHPDFQRFYGKRADKVRKLYNGMIPCYLYQYFKNPKMDVK
jgi:putative N6-adenine-specific DNA methylase